MASAKKSNVSYFIWVGISLVLMFLFGRVVPSFAQITPVGISIIGIFLGVLVVILATGETFWPSVIGLFALIVCDYMGASQLLASWFGNVTIQQIIWVMALTGAVTESGAVNVLARKVLMIKALKGHPMRLIMTLFFTVLICSALVSSPTTMLLLFYPILDGICEMCGVEKNSDLKRGLLLGVYISAMGAYVLPFKGVHLSSIAIISGIMEASGLTFNNGVYLGIATLVIVVFILLYVGLMKFVWRTDFSPLKNFDYSQVNFTKDELRMNGRQKTLLGFMIAGVLFLLASMVLPQDSVLFALYNKIGSTWIWIILFGILCMMRTKEGKPYIDGVKLLQSKTMWGIVAVAGCFTILGTAIASDDLGIKAAISEALAPILGNATWPLMVILCVVVSTVFTNITNGMPVSFTINAVCIPIACTMQMAGNGNATVLAVATILSSMCAFLSYGAIAYAPLMLGREEMTSKFVWTKGVMTAVGFMVVCSLICIVFGLIL